MNQRPRHRRPPRPTARRTGPRLPWVVRYVSVLVLGALLLVGTSALVLPRLGDFGDQAVHSTDAPIVLAPLATRSYIYDRNGGELAVLYAEQDREEVSLDQVPELVQESVITVEDREFYTHNGVNLRSAVRALFSNIEAGGIEQGGSTITQQLVKNAVVGSERTLGRKVKEAALAMQLEEQMSKQEILERYLNTVYLGHGAYGMQAASETYFNKGVGEIGWAEAALLTALIRNPVGYDPIRFPEIALQRRALVADLLLDERVITEAEREAIEATPLPTETFSRAEASESAKLAGASYFSESVKQQLLDLPQLGTTPQERYDAVFGGGLRVTTTFDPDAQELAEEAVDSLPDTKGEFVASLASVEPASGAVRALVGGTDFKTNKFNYATQGWRQPGSSFKFFVLMAAFEYGAIVPNDTISGSSPCRFPDPSAEGGVYEAENSGKGGKTSTIESQTLSSSNCAFLRLGQVVGLDKVAALANALGVSTLVEQRDEAGEIIRDDKGQSEFTEGAVPSNVLSLPLGTKEVHPVAMAGAYAAAANDGVYHEPYLIESIQDADGKVLYQHEDPGLQVVSVQTARLVNQVLESNVTSGTGRRARLDDRPAAGKTGTTQKNSDVWFVGYTPQLSTAVWIGSPDGQKPVVIRGKSQFGADEPSRIWNAFMEPYHDELPVEEFAAPESTRKGKALKYTSTADTKRRSSSSRSSSSRRSATTVPKAETESTAPSGGAGGDDGAPAESGPPAEEKPKGNDKPKDEGGGTGPGPGGGP